MVLKFKVADLDKKSWLELDRQREPIARAAVAALRETARNAVKEGRENIASAGPGFRHAQWLSGLRYRAIGATKAGEAALDAKVLIYHKYGIAGVFEHGATIKGRPLLWIPTKHGGASPVALMRQGKKFTFARIGGTPVLFDANDRDRHRKPLYIGTPSVRIPKKFRIFEIAKEQAKLIAAIFFKHLGKS
jgi:Family of unknown function (DUF6441)